MDPQVKQKVMIGGLAVLILGAGSYFVFFSGDSGPKQQAASTVSTAPRERQVTSPNAKVRTVTRTQEPSKAEAAPEDRKERVQTEREEGARRTRPTAGPERKSKVKKTPAA